MSHRCRARIVRVARLVVVILASLAACSLRGASERAVLGREVIRIGDVAYDTGARQRLDVYLPRRPRATSPVMVFLYGGRWKYGAKRDWVLLANTLARRGWVVVVPEYRRWPQVLFPAWVEDGARAVRWTLDNVAGLGGDTSRVVVVGHSAGAHTVALLALDEHFLRDAGVDGRRVHGYVSLAGPVDTAWTARDVQRLMGPREGWPATYPATHVGGDEQPLLLLHGTGDDVVTAGSSVRLAERIRARGGCARADLYRGVNHVEIVLALALPRTDLAPVLRDVTAFARDPAGTTCATAPSSR